MRQEAAPSAHGQCKKDELFFRNACYYWSKNDDEPVSQERAHNEKCRSRNATLASISTIHENAFIAAETSAVAGSNYWTGLVYNITSVQGAFSWLDATSVNFTKWGMYEPAYQKEGSQSCVLFRSDGREFVWSVSNCSSKASYVCKSNLTDTRRAVLINLPLLSKGMLTESDKINLTTSDTLRGCQYLKHLLCFNLISLCLCLDYSYTCPNCWTKFGSSSCFKLVKTKKTWRDSLTDCENLEEERIFARNISFHSSLARIISDQEQHDISANLIDIGEAWIGLNDIVDEGFYVWSDGSPLIYVNWDFSEAGKESFLRKDHDCVAATKNSWKTMLCAEKKSSICFIPAILGMHAKRG